MGLDFVEIVMEVEDQFGIHFKLDELSHVRTVGDFVAVIRARISAAADTTCPCLTQFHRLRQLVRQTTGEPDLRIRPKSSLQATLTTEECRRLWQRLPDVFGYTPPDLAVPPKLRQFLVRLSLYSLTCSLAYTLKTDILLLPLALLLNAFLAITIYQISTSFRSVPPVGWETYGDVTRQLIRTVMAVKNLHLKTDEAILNQLQPIFHEILNVDPCEVVPNALLIEDLGVG
jgi:acyl carrier protein